jgi:histidinol phosphatase-like PHP family hydrolase
MEVPAMLRECERLGVTCLGITDHLNSLDKLKDHLPIRDDILRLETEVEVYFGVELNFTGCDQGFAFSQAVKEQLGFQFAVGGIHGAYLKEYDVRKLVDIQHRHHLKTCEDPLVEVLVHPYWFWKGEFDKGGWPWFDSMKPVPESYARELAQASKETGTAIEINGSANLDNPDYSKDFVKEYFDYLAILADEGAIFTVASDAHDIKRMATVQAAWQVVERLNVPPDRVWRPTCRPMAGGKG